MWTEFKYFWHVHWEDRLFLIFAFAILALIRLVMNLRSWLTINIFTEKVKRAC